MDVTLTTDEIARIILLAAEQDPERYVKPETRSAIYRARGIRELIQENSISIEVVPVGGDSVGGRRSRRSH